ncbi:MAG: hypothetical protein GY705_20640 [Bacteroidetes bacterium]|nr:hypothetical protein [Bacteroidota bacterium]
MAFRKKPKPKEGNEIPLNFEISHNESREHRHELKEYGEFEKGFIREITEKPRGRLAELFEYDHEAAYGIWKEISPLVKEIAELEKTIEQKRNQFSKLFKKRKNSTLDKAPSMKSEQAEINDLYAEVEVLRKGKLLELYGKQDDLLFEYRIAEVRENSEHWAKQFTKERDYLKKESERENQKRLLAQKNGDDYFEPHPKASFRLTQLDTKIELARGKLGITPDHLSEIVDDYHGMWESGYKYFKTIDDLKRKLTKMDFKEASTVLEDGYLDGKYSDENYYSMKRIIRQHFEE